MTNLETDKDGFSGWQRCTQLSAIAAQTAVESMWPSTFLLFICIHPLQCYVLAGAASEKQLIQRATLKGLVELMPLLNSQLEIRINVIC